MAVNDFVSVAVQTITEQTEQANAVADKILNADNANKLIHEVRNTSEDPEIVAFRTWIEKANAQILKRELEIDQYIKDAGLVDVAPVDIESETTNYNSLATQIKGMLGALKTIPGSEDVLGSIPELKPIPGKRKASSTSSSSTGTRRPRLSSITVSGIDGSNPVDVYENVKQEDGSTKTVTNMTVLSKWLTANTEGKPSVNVQDLQSSLFAAAKTEDLSTLDGKPIEFPVIVGDAHYLVTATPNKK